MDEINEKDGKNILKRRIPSAWELKRMHASSTDNKIRKTECEFQDVVHVAGEESGVKSNGATESNIRPIESFKLDPQQIVEFRKKFAWCSFVKMGRTYPESKVEDKTKLMRKERKNVQLKTAEKRLDIYRRVSRDNSWVAPRSYHGLLQEKHCDDPWKVLVICMLLNRTRGCQVSAILPIFFDLVPNAEAAVEVGEEELKEVIKPLGLYNSRTALIKKFSAAYLCPDWTHVTSLPGVGKYAADAYAIFCNGRPEDVKPSDHKLLPYWRFLCRWCAQQQQNSPMN